MELEHFESAILNLENAIDSGGEIDAFFLPETYAFLAKAYLGQQRHDDAVIAGQKALSTGLESKNQEFIGIAWRASGEIAAETGSVSVNESEYSAADCFAESVAAFEAGGVSDEQLKSLRLWADYETRQGDSQKGAELRQQADGLAESSGI